MRSLSGIETASEIAGPGHVIDSIVYFFFLALRVLIATGLFGWMTLSSLPRMAPNSKETVNFWRFKKQAEKDMQKVGEFRGGGAVIDT